MLSHLLKYICTVLIFASCSHHYSYYPISIEGERGVSLENEHDIMEMVCRNILGRGPYPATFYISFGKEKSKEIDPPRSFLKRLEDLELDVKPISEKPSESDREIHILTVEIPYWINDVEAKVLIRYFRHLTPKQWYSRRGAEKTWSRFSGVAIWSEGTWRLAILDRDTVES